MPLLKIPFLRCAPALGILSLLPLGAMRLPAQAVKPPVKAEEPTLAFDASNVTLRTALQSLAKAAKVKIVVQSDVTDTLLTVHFGPMPLHDILATIFQTTGESLDFVVSNGVYTVMKAEQKPPQPVINQPLNLNFTNTDARAIITLLVKMSKVKYKIDDAVPHTNINMKATYPSLKAALEELANRSGKAFVYRIENGVYHFYAYNAKDVTK